MFFGQGQDEEWVLFPSGTTSKSENARKCGLLGLVCFPVFLSLYLGIGAKRRIFFLPPENEFKNIKHENYLHTKNMSRNLLTNSAKQDMGIGE